MALPRSKSRRNGSNTACQYSRTKSTSFSSTSSAAATARASLWSFSNSHAPPVSSASSQLRISTPVTSNPADFRSHRPPRSLRRRRCRQRRAGRPADDDGDAHPSPANARPRRSRGRRAAREVREHARDDVGVAHGGGQPRATRASNSAASAQPDSERRGADREGRARHACTRAEGQHRRGRLASASARAIARRIARRSRRARCPSPWRI